jgi:hypothetical protein
MAEQTESVSGFLWPKISTGMAGLLSVANESPTCEHRDELMTALKMKRKRRKNVFMIITLPSVISLYHGFGMLPIPKKVKHPLLTKTENGYVSMRKEHG